MILYLVKPMGSSVFIGPEESKRTSKLGPTVSSPLTGWTGIPGLKKLFYFCWITGLFV